MTDPDLLAKKLAFVESCVADLRRLAVAANIESDVKERCWPSIQRKRWSRPQQRRT